MNNKQEVDFADGKASSSQMPNFKYIPYRSLVRLARRFDLGIERKKEKAWNALSNNQDVLKDLDFTVERASHTSHHALKLIAILTGRIPDDGDDHAAAIAWGGHFLCEATEERNQLLTIGQIRSQVSAAVSCHGCSALMTCPIKNTEDVRRRCWVCGTYWLLTGHGWLMEVHSKTIDVEVCSICNGEPPRGSSKKLGLEEICNTCKASWIWSSMGWRRI